MSEHENKIRWSITIDPDLARRIDAVVQERGEARSEFIERHMRSAIGDEEQFLQSMEGPVPRALMTVLVNTPVLLKIIANAVGEQIKTEGEEQHLKDSVRQDIKIGKQRAANKKNAGKVTPKPV